MTIACFKIYDTAVLLAGGGNMSTSSMVLVSFIYQEAFTHYDMGYASAMAWFLLLIVMSITVVNLIASKYWVHTEEGET